ncbi:MAG TPA: hypothetical protein VH085_00515 [Nocardioides sp.]|jgi:hypothetical protein|nr:hypothetical protein [Nocardioides sp.]
MGRGRWLTRLGVLLPVAGLLLACHAATPDTQGAGDQAGSSPEAITERAVAHELSSVTVPSGSRTASAAEARSIGPVEWTESDNRVDRHATYVVPLSTDETIAWFSAHPPAGMSNSGSSTSSSDGTTVTSGLIFDSAADNPAYDALEGDVAARSSGDGSTLVRVDVQAVWLLTATEERVPLDATSVRIVQVTAHHEAVHRATLSGHAVRRLARLIDAQRTIAPGIGSCGNDTGAHDTLTFTGAWPDRQYRATVSGCPFIAVRVSGKTLPALLQGAFQVDRLVTRLVRTRR